MHTHILEAVYLDAVSALKSPIRSPKLIRLAQETKGVAYRALNEPKARSTQARKLHRRLLNEVGVINVVSDIGNRVAGMLEQTLDGEYDDGIKLMCRDSRSALLVDLMPTQGALVSFEVDNALLEDLPYQVQNERTLAKTITAGFSLNSWYRREYPSTLYEIAYAIKCKGGIANL